VRKGGATAPACTPPLLLPKNRVEKLFIGCNNFPFRRD
jgi:ssDNA-binding Zn-finger/Zn-ribbon topoisomerase 1